MDRCGKSKIPLTIRPAIAPPLPAWGGGDDSNKARNGRPVARRASDGACCMGFVG